MCDGDKVVATFDRGLVHLTVGYRYNIRTWSDITMDVVLIDAGVGILYFSDTENVYSMPYSYIKEIIEV